MEWSDMPLTKTLKKTLKIRNGTLVDDDVRGPPAAVRRGSATKGPHDGVTCGGGARAVLQGRSLGAGSEDDEQQSASASSRSPW